MVVSTSGFYKQTSGLALVHFENGLSPETLRLEFRVHACSALNFTTLYGEEQVVTCWHVILHFVLHIAARMSFYIHFIFAERVWEINFRMLEIVVHRLSSRINERKQGTQQSP